MLSWETIESVVLQLLQGYVGQFVKDIQKEQFKITPWKEEVLLENVELNFEAFDYLQLPFALKQGRVGRLSIKIPWKKLVWDPIILILEDVYISASQRDDQDWCSEAAERREFASKKVTLAKAELAKLSSRVCGSQPGKSFSSYIAFKVLEHIEVSIRNVQIQYCDIGDAAQVAFGLKLSSLTMKRNPAGSSSGWARADQVDKIVEILGLGLYCSTIQGDQDLMSIGNIGESKLWNNASCDGNTYDYILVPFDMSVSLLLNISGKLDIGAPQHSVTAELKSLVMSLDEVQLQQILVLWDHLCTCRLREKYGRYRPWSFPISRKTKGWQTAWWHYAQESVLSDVRKKLKKTSWRYLGQRLSYRRNYVNLYKTKLNFLQRQQSVDEYTLLELELMEKESDIDDILSYRSAAEHELQATETSQNDDYLSGKRRGWLNWLSRGMLGAGGTDDSSQFSGVVSDEVIQDIYEATEFDPAPLSNGDAATNEEICVYSVKFSIYRISATLRSMKLNREAAELIFNEVVIEHKQCEESATVIAIVNSMQMVYPCQKKAILLMERKSVLDTEQPSVSMQFDLSPINQEVELSVKVMLQPFEVNFDSEFFLDFMELCSMLSVFEFHHKRVLSSLDGIEDVKVRLLSKAEYILSSRRKVFWDICFTNIILNIPWRTENSIACNMVLESGSLFFVSKSDRGFLTSEIEDQSSIMKSFLSSLSTSDFSMGFQLHDLYDHFEVNLNDFEIKIVRPHHPQTIPVIERFSASITFSSCIIPVELMMKQLEVYIIVSSLHAHFSSSIYDAFTGLISQLEIMHLRPEPFMVGTLESRNLMSHERTNPVSFSIAATLDMVSLHVNLENDGESSSVLQLTLRELSIRYAHKELEEFWICMKGLKIITYLLGCEKDSHDLCSAGNLFAANCAHQHDMGVGLGNQNDNHGDGCTYSDGCFLLQYEARRSVGAVSRKCTVCLSDTEIHCYPYIFGLLVGFIDKLSSHDASSFGENFSSPNENPKHPKVGPGFGMQRFGFSNFFETGSSECASIPLDHFPFVTICNSGSLGNLESSLIFAIPEWRKNLNLRDRKIRSPKFSIKKGFKNFISSTLKSTSVMAALSVSGSTAEANVFIVNLNLVGTKIHFHDSSCILATITLPISKSSLYIDEDCVDVLCSTEGATLSSSWWTEDLHEFLWGPSLPNLSPILNIRVKKGNDGSLSSQTDICFSVQHVCCILPPDFLAIIIGYFSLPGWTSNANEQPVSETHKNMGIENHCGITYKFEILDSTLLSPIKSGSDHFVKLKLPQLYCSFIHENTSYNILKDIPLECLLPAHKVSKKYHSLNIFGRDLSLSLLFPKEDIILIATLGADLWVTIPNESEPCSGSSPLSTSIMSKINNCQLIVEDGYIGGFEALVDVINQFSLVGEASKGFTSDVLQFRQLRRFLKENGEVSAVASTDTFTELRFCTNSLLINLNHSRKDLTSLEQIAKADMQFICSASLRNDIPLNLDFRFSSLALYSMCNSVMLARCTSIDQDTSVLDINLSKSDQAGNQLFVSLPSLDIWLHLLDWNEVIDHFNSCAGHLTKNSSVDASSKGPSLDPVHFIDNVSVTIADNVLQLSDEMKDTIVLIVKSENIGITFHIPVCVDEVLNKFGVAEVQEYRSQNVPFNEVESTNFKFVTVTLQSSGSELGIGGRSTKLKLNLEKVSGAVETCEDKSIHSWPFFQTFQVNVDAEICNDHVVVPHVRGEVRCDRLDVWLSHQVLNFWYDVGLKTPEAGSSQIKFNGVDFEVKLRKVSFLLTDGRWSCNGPLLEILLRNLAVHANLTENKIRGSATSDFEVNYNNIHKVMWEPFIEPWKLRLSIIRGHEKSALLNSSMITDISLESTTQLNLNFTETLIESLFRATEMIQDAWGLKAVNDNPNTQRFLYRQISENICAGRYAPYVVQNLTSLPLVFHVYQGLVSAEEFDMSTLQYEKYVQPGSFVQIYISETPEEQLFRCRPAHSSDRLSDKLANGVSHYFITIQFDGTDTPSTPISMDLVGLSYFEVDFSKPSKKVDVQGTKDAIYGENIQENSRTEVNSGFVVPVVFDVSVQRYSKLVRLYSTVMLLNATSMPLELRFDIPFGVSPKILDPIYPGQEFPLPLHLAEAGRMRWRPLGNTYLWSEAHNLSNILSRDSRMGFLRSFVCYPSHPSSDPFRCCISVEDVILPSSGMPKKSSSLHTKCTSKQSVNYHGQVLRNLDKSKKRYIHQVTLSTPLVVRNYLPKEVLLTIESGGVTRTSVLSEVVTSFFHIDSSHDLGLVVCMDGFKPCVLKFPRTETFSALAKFSGTKFSQTEIMTFDSDICNGPMYVSVEKVMDAFSGARELCISVPFLLYNCTGVSLTISEAGNETIGNLSTIPSCYDLGEQELLLCRKDGLSLLSPNQDSYATSQRIDNLKSSFSENHIVSTRKNVSPYLGRFLNKPLVSYGSSTMFCEHSIKDDLDYQSESLNNMMNRSSPSIQLNKKESRLAENECRKVKAYMYSPKPPSSSNEIMVRVTRCSAEVVSDHLPNSSWSNPFFLVPSSGSTTVLVPQQSTNAASILSVTCNTVAGQFAGRTRAITFQPRYVICNACSQDLCYKQKGTDFIFHLGVGQHAHLHWIDTTRELLVSVRFIEPGWQWSGSFLPDHLGDTQVKMRNYISGAINMIRVEVQNPDISIKDEKIVGSLNGISGTNLILISDDDTGFMPYRIDNFSKERLRIYQQRCETFETIVHSYTSCPYAWDEPCYPHRLTVEVPGERVVGSYILDDVKEYMPVCLPANSENSERTLLVSVHAEGARKVISIIDSGYHILRDIKDPRARRYRGERQHDQRQGACVDYTEKISVSIPYIGISLMDSYPKELLFACARNITIDLLQSLDQQKLAFQISSLQIDNQLHNTPYPVILSFDQEYRNKPVGQMRAKDEASKTTDNSGEPVLYLAAAKWRNKDTSLVSFEYIILRVADFHLELEQEMILSLFDFLRMVFIRFQSEELPFVDSSLHSLDNNVNFVKDSSTHAPPCKYVKANVPMSTENHKSSSSLPSIVPIGAPWQKIYLLARRQKKIYVEMFDLAPIKLNLSFSSTPWLLRNGIPTSGESLIHRGLMALADVEGAQIKLKQLTIAHHMASWDSVQQILIRHYTRQLRHEIYKVFGSAGVIGNPLGFARSMGLGIKDFLSVPARSILQSPTGLITGMAQGTTSLLSNTVYAISDAATQMSKAAHKGIVAFTFDDQAVAKMEKQQKGVASQSRGVINEVLEGLTGLLQSPIRGAEKHGLPGVVSGIALGVTGLVARPAASILEVTGKTAQSIRNRSKLFQMGTQRFRARLPRPLSKELPLRPYSWEEAVGRSVVMEIDDGSKMKGEDVLVTCKRLKQGGKFVIITERLVITASCSSLVAFDEPGFRGIPADPEWVIEAEIGLESVIHADMDEEIVHIVGSSSETVLKRGGGGGSSGMKTKRWSNPTPLPLFLTNLEMGSKVEAEDLLRILLSVIEQGKERGWGTGYLLHQSNLK